MLTNSRLIKSAAAHSPDTLRIAVISDIHIAHDIKHFKGQSYYAANMADQDPRNNPFVGLQKVISKEGLKTDYLLCCGDITDKAHPAALTHGWDQLAKIAAKLNAKALLGTAGNHDVDSRFSFAEFDARGVASTLTPPFPIAHQHLSDQYWARHFCVLEGGNYRIVLLNSAAYHGEGGAFTSPESDDPPTTGTPEYFHGRVSSRTLFHLRAYLDEAEHRDINILVCHHHPTVLEAVPDNDYSEMQGGLDLLNLLGEPGRGYWLIVHGHRHVAAIQRTLQQPFIFCAGSFGKVLPSNWPSSNQFYIVELLADPRNTVGLSIAGRFRSWTWTRPAGWKSSSFDERLPGYGGFGYLGEVWVIAEQIAKNLETAPSPTLYLTDLLVPIPWLSYVAPSDWPYLTLELKKRGVQVLHDREDGDVYFLRNEPKPRASHE